MDPLVVIFVVAASFVVAWFVSTYSRLPTVIGRRGEIKVENALASKLDPNEYFRFHDLALPIGGATTQIDHVVVSRFGIFVIETKNYSGWIFGNAKSRIWTQTLRRNKYKFQNPLRQNFKHTKAVEAFLCLSSHSVFSVIVFVGSSEFRTDLPSNVMTLKELYPYIRSRRDLIISAQKVEWIIDRLLRQKAGLPTRSSEATHLRLVNPDPRCPKCGEKMVICTVRRGVNAGREFLGCSQFPKCKGTRKTEYRSQE